ncbi:MAG: hypothetical protein ABMB14_26600 [Myxococcota bacterium]
MLWLALACTAPDPTGSDPSPSPSDADPTGSDPTTATSWTVPTATTPPVFDAASLGAGLNDAIDLALVLSADELLTVYDGLMQYGDGGCPYTYGYDTTYGYGFSQSWYNQCDASGATFSGYASEYTSYDYQSDGDGYRAVYLDCTILSPDGATLSGAGYFASSAARYGRDLYLAAYLDGVAAYDGPGVDGPWFTVGLQPSIDIERVIRGDFESHAIDVDGQVAGLTGAIDTVDFDLVSFDADRDCAEPTGTIAVRTPEGDWFDVAFDGDPDHPKGCDGCGDASWRGLAQGEVCGTFDRWTTGEAP